jgi:hypothetical protein
MWHSVSDQIGGNFPEAFMPKSKMDRFDCDADDSNPPNPPLRPDVKVAKTGVPRNSNVMAACSPMRPDVKVAKTGVPRLMFNPGDILSTGNARGAKQDAERAAKRDVKAVMHTMLDAIVWQAIDKNLLVRSGKSSTGFKGVSLHQGRYKATCHSPPCHGHHLGMFGTAEEAAQAYLQHWEEKHPEELEK